MTPETLDQIALVVGAVLTVMVFSYLLGDNVLYRLAIHIFIGAAAGFILITAIESVLAPWVRETILKPPLELPRLGVGLIPFLIGFLLWFKSSPRLAPLGNVGLMIVLGIGTALAVWGAISVSMLPMALATIRELTPENVINGVIIVFGTVAVLIYFTYVGLRRPGGQVTQALPIRVTGLFGRAVIVITLGATYGLLIITALTVLVSTLADRVLILASGG